MNKADKSIRQKRASAHYSFYFLYAALMHLLLFLFAIYWLPQQGINRIAAKFVPTYLYRASSHVSTQAFHQQMKSLPTPSLHPVKTALKRRVAMTKNASYQPQTPSRNYAVQNKQEENIILNLLHTAIAEKQMYPEIAAALNQTGTVTIQFLLFPDGHLSNISVAKSSGIPSLDTAALAAVQAISPAKAAGSHLQQSQFFSIDIVFG